MSRSRTKGNAGVASTDTLDLDLPDVRELDLPARLRDARTQLADRIDPERPARRLRRRVLWVGLFTAAVSAVTWALLSRRPAELHELSEPTAAPTPATTTNGATPITADTTSG